MRRTRRLALLCVVLSTAGLAAAQGGGADGCPPSKCGTLSLTKPGSQLVTVLPSGPFGALQAFDVVTGKKRFSLGYGRLSPDGSWHFVSQNREDDTLVRRFDARTGRKAGSWTVAGRYWWIGATSARGRHVVLAHATNGKRSRFLVVDGRSGALVRTVRLDGSFEPEAVSRDGRRLFLIEHLGREYQIRLYDLARGRLVGGAIRPKNEDERMTGYPWTAVGTPDGRWRLTLYIRPNGGEAFIHALDLEHAAAYCLDLPGAGRAGALQQYGLALSSDAQTLYAANGAIGAAARLDLKTLRVTPLARFRSGRDPEAQWGSAALSPDGRTLYFGGLHGLWAYHGSTGLVRGPYRVGPVAGFGFTPDGERVTVIRFGKRPLSLDAATGRTVGAPRSS